MFKSRCEQCWECWLGDCKKARSQLPRRNWFGILSWFSLWKKSNRRQKKVYETNKTWTVTKAATPELTIRVRVGLGLGLEWRLGLGLEWRLGWRLGLELGLGLERNWFGILSWFSLWKKKQPTTKKDYARPTRPARAPRSRQINHKGWRLVMAVLGFG